MIRSDHRGLTCTIILATLASTTLAFAAPLGKKDKAKPAPPVAPSTANTGTSPVPATDAPLPKEGLYEKLLQHGKTKDWILNAEMRMSALFTCDAYGVRGSVPLKVEKGSIVFPIPAKSSSHEAADLKKITSTIRFDGGPINAIPQFMEGFPGGTRLGRWDLVDVVSNRIVLNLQVPMVSAETILDEDLAKRIPWPTKPLPAIAASTLQPQLGVDFEPVLTNGATNDQQIKETKKRCEDLIKQWTNGQDLKKLPQWTAVKFLAQQVSTTVQTSGNGLRNNDDTTLAGFELKGALRTLNDGRGSDMDLVCALAAVYRTAGIPCRTVIALDASSESGNSGLSPKGKNKGRDRLAAWLEVALIDPNTNKEMWIPVDLLKLKGKSNQLPDLDKPWRYFGSNDDLVNTMPIAYQFHPPTNVYAQGYPAIYGWSANAQVPPVGKGHTVATGATQSIRFFSTTQPMTADDQRAKREEQEKNKPQR